MRTEAITIKRITATEHVVFSSCPPCVGFFNSRVLR